MRKVKEGVRTYTGKGVTRILGRSKLKTHTTLYPIFFITKFFVIGKGELYSTVETPFGQLVFMFRFKDLIVKTK